MAEIPLLKGETVDNNVDYRDALPVNYYAVIKNIHGTDGYLLNYYGLASFADGQGESRGAIWVARPQFEGQYRVSGENLIFIEDDQSVTILGTVPGTDQASMAYSLNNLAIVADGKLFYYNPSAGFREITDPDVGTPIDITWADFRFILTDGEFLFQSSIVNEEQYEPLEFTGSDFQPDEIKGVGINEDNQLIAFNSYSTEYFFNSGAENFAYTRISNKAVKAGIISTNAKVEYMDQWYCLTRRINTQPQFSIIQSGTAQSITTREIEKVLAEYTDEQLSTTVIEVFVKDAVTWMIAHLPDKTLAFNATLAQSQGIEYAWSILKSDVLGDKTYRAKDTVYDPRFSKWIIGDKESSDIGFLDDSTCTHYGEVVEGLFYTPILSLEALSIDHIDIESIPGISPNNDATVFIALTYDSRVYGKEWSKDYGLNFDYNNRFYVNRLGYVRENVSFRFRTASSGRMAFGLFNLEAS